MSRLGPGTLYCRACVWTNISLRNRIQTNYEGLKITTCTSSWANYDNKRRKDQNPAATSEARSESTVLHIIPAQSTTEAGGRPPEPSAQSKPPICPTLTPWKKPVHTPWGVSKCTCFLFSSLCAAARVPAKPCLDFSSDLLSVSTDGRAHRLRWVIRCTAVCGRGVEAIWCPLLGVWADTGQWVPTREHQQH